MIDFKDQLRLRLLGGTSAAEGQHKNCLRWLYFTLICQAIPPFAKTRKDGPPSISDTWRTV